MKLARVFCLSVATAFLPITALYASNDAVLIPRADLFGNPQKSYSNISPDAKWVSWLAPLAGVVNLWVAPIDHLDQAQPVTQDKLQGISTTIETLMWSYDYRHLLYLQDRNGDGNSHLYAVDIADRTTKDLTPFDHVRARIVGLSAHIRDEVLISLNKRDPKFADLYRVNLKSSAITPVMENSGYLGFFADDRLNPQLAVKREPSGDMGVLRVSKDGVTPWLTIPAAEARTTSILAIDSAGKSVFALDSRGRDTVALVRLDLATAAESVLAQDAHADVRDVIFDQKSNEPLAYATMVARLEHRAVTPKYQADLDFLAAQNLGDWTVDSRSEDDRYWKMTVQTSARLLAYLYDRKSKTVTKLYDPRPSLTAAPLVDMHPVTIKSRDGLDLVSYLSIPKSSDPKQTAVPDAPVPLVMVVHGGPHNRDVFGFSAIHQWLANRGYAALSVNMRGSTGFGKAFTNASVGEWGNKLDDDLSDAVSWAIQNKIADPAHIAIMGASYGGYATLNGLTRNPDTYACGLDSFGPSDLTNVLQGQAAYLTAGGVAYNNEFGDPGTQEGRDRMKDQSPIYHADRIKKPLLVVQGANDPGVNRAQSDRMVAAVKAAGVPVTYLLYPDEGHGLQRTENNMALYAIEEQFLGKCLGGRSEPVTNADLKGSSVQVLEGTDQIEGLATAMAQPSASSSIVR